MKKETSNPGTGTVHKKSLKQQIYYYRSFYIMFIPVFIFGRGSRWPSGNFPFFFIHDSHLHNKYTT